MRHFIAILILFAAVASAKDFDPYQGPTPVLVLMTTDPWAMVIGADLPRLVAYEDGTVIYEQEQNKVVGLWVTHLSPEHLSKLVDIARPLIGIPDPERRYDLAPGVTDQPTTHLLIAEKSVTKVIEVYGLSSKGRTFKEQRQGESPPPPQFMKAHKALVDYAAPDAKPWVPLYIEVLLWSYSYAPDASIVWPGKWPNLDSLRTRKRGDSYSIYLDGTELQSLKEFVATRKEKGTVELSGKKFAIAYRYALPSEPVWMKAFNSK